MSDIDSDANVRENGFGNHLGAPGSKLLQDRGDEIDIFVGVRVFKGFRNTNEGDKTNLVIKGLGDDSVVGYAICIWLEGSHVANLHLGEGIGFVGCGDVNPEIFGREGLASLFFVLEVDGLLTDDACDGAVLALDDNTETGEDVGVDSANLIEIQEAAVVDVTNHETNLVGMRHEHNLGTVFAFAMGDAVAVGAGRDFVDIGTDCFGEESSNALLAA